MGLQGSMIDVLSLLTSFAVLITTVAWLGSHTIAPVYLYDLKIPEVFIRHFARNHTALLSPEITGTILEFSQLVTYAVDIESLHIFAAVMYVLFAVATLMKTRLGRGTPLDPQEPYSSESLSSHRFWDLGFWFMFWLVSFSILVMSGHPASLAMVLLISLVITFCGQLMCDAQECEEIPMAKVEASLVYGVAMTLGGLMIQGKMYLTYAMKALLDLLLFLTHNTNNATMESLVLFRSGYIGVSLIILLFIYMSRQQ